MKPLLLAILGIFLVVVALSVVSQAVDGFREPSYAELVADQVRADRLQQQAELDEAWAPVERAISAALLFGALLAVLCYLGALGALHVRRTALERTPNSAGLLPLLASDQRTAQAALASFHMARQIEAQRQPVPTHYAPHITISQAHAPAIAALPAPAAEPPVLPALPGLTDLASLGFRPTREAILLGLDTGGNRVTVPAQALCHVALVGATGGGKSNLLRLLLPQLQAIGAKVVLADPHYTPYDPESGDDWRAIAARLHLPPAVRAREIDSLLGYLLDELDRRLQLRERGQTWGPPLFLAFDELPVIADSVPGAMERLGRVLREGRKVHILAVGASQTMLVKAIGGDSSVRDAYRTAFYVGGDLRSAVALLDLPQREIDEGALTTGVAYLRSSSTAPAQLVRVPLASNAAIAQLLPMSASDVASFPASIPASFPAAGSGKRSEHEATHEAGASGVPTRSTRDQHILALIRQQKGISEIIEKIWGVKGGSKYSEHSAEVMRVIAENLRGEA